MKTISLKRVIQLPDLCGPATLEMLLSQYGIEVDQLEICKRANALTRASVFGLRVDDLAAALSRIDSNLSLWAKHHASFEDINHLINTHHLAIGVEWQSDLEDEDSEEGDDVGHYSVIVAADPEQRTILLRDPEMEDEDRLFLFEEFEALWYDTNEIGEAEPAEAHRWANDTRMLFVVAPHDSEYLASLGLSKVHAMNRSAVTH